MHAYYLRQFFIQNASDSLFHLHDFYVQNVTPRFKKPDEL